MARRRGATQGRAGRGRRPPTTSARTPARPGRASRVAAPDPVAAYRDAAGYGPTIRVALLAAVSLLDLSLLVRATRHDAPPVVGAAGIAAMAFFFGAVFLRHLVALYRIRSRHPDLLQPSLRLVAGMLQAPFGLGNPRPTALDRLLLRATLVLGAALLPLLFLAGAANRS